MKPKKPKIQDNTICLNRKALHDYSLLEKYEAGVELQGWEVKSLRDGRAQLKESHIFIRQGEAFLLNCHISPLISTCTHTEINSTRSRKLLLHRKELNHLMGKVEQKGLTIVPLSLYWKNHKVKASIALAQGKKLHDKRAAEKDRSWEREQSRIMKNRSLNN